MGSIPGGGGGTPILTGAGMLVVPLRGRGLVTCEWTKGSNISKARFKRRISYAPNTIHELSE